MASTETDTPAPVHPGAHIADPGPLGLAGFASTTLVLSLVNAGAVGEGTEISAVVALAFFYGGLAQLLAGMWEFRKGNTFGATAFPTFGAFWIAFAAFVVFFAPMVPKEQAGVATGMFLLVFLIVTAYLTLAAMRTNVALLSVFVLLTLTYLFLVLAELGAGEALGTVGGVLGIATAVVAFYTSAAGVVNATWKRVVLPVIPLAPAA